MAVRRRYKTGGPAPVDVDPVAVAEPPAAPVAQTPEPEPENQLVGQIAAQAHAEELQRQSPQHQAAPVDHQQQVAAHIDSLPISEHKKAFLYQYPQLLVEPLNHLMRHQYQIALHAGVEDDTPAMNEAILVGIQRDLEHHRALTSANARPTLDNAQAHQEASQAAQELTREAEAIMAERQADQPAALPAPRRSIPMSAPVSREVPLASGDRASQDNTLTVEEREVARNSFTDQNLTNSQKEQLYWQNKRKLKQMRASGAYPMPERN